MKLKQQMRVALMASVLCVTSQWAIPMGGVPMTMQTFFMALAGATLGPVAGAVSALVYLLIGAVGLPVYSSMHAGAGWLIGPTGGYLWSFPVLALLCGLCAKRAWWVQALSGLAGLGILYIMGTGQFMLVTGRGFAEALGLCVVPFAPKDVLCIGLAVGIGRTVKRRMEHV